MKRVLSALGFVGFAVLTWLNAACSAPGPTSGGISPLYAVIQDVTPQGSGHLTYDPLGNSTADTTYYRCSTSDLVIVPTPHPESGFHFDHWEKDCVGGQLVFAGTSQCRGGNNSTIETGICRAVFAEGSPVDGGMDLATSGCGDMQCNPLPVTKRATGLTGGGPIAYGPNGFILLGPNDALATSTDGISWSLGNFGNLKGNTYTGIAVSPTATNHYVAVGGQIVGVDGSAFYSPDAKTWTKATGPTLAYDVIWDGKQFVTIATYGGQICTSPDGVAWTCSTVAALANAYPAHLFFEGGQYLVLGYDKAQKAFLATSPDAVNWTAQPSAAAATTKHLVTVAFANNTYVAGTVGDQSGPDILTSSDGGKTWTPQQSANAMASAGGPGGFGAVGWTGTWWVADLGGNSFVISPDATNWQRGLPIVNGEALAMTTGGPRGMVAVYGDGSVGTVEK